MRKWNFVAIYHNYKLALEYQKEDVNKFQKMFIKS